MSLGRPISSRQGELRAVDSLIETIGQREDNRFIKTFNAFARDSAEDLRKTGISPSQETILKHFKRIQSDLEILYRTAGNISAERQFSTLLKSRWKTYSIKQAQQDFDRLLQEFINSQSFDKANEIAQTSIDEVRRILSDGLEEGLSNDEIAKSIGDKFEKELSKSRTTRIVRTETHNALMFANLASTQILNDDLNLGLMKEWVAVEDDRTREDHMIADGQTVPLNGRFTVGPDQMLRPGDPNASPGNVINCRCALAFVPSQ